MTAEVERSGALRGDRRARLRAWLVSPGAGALLVSVLFLAITLWWVLTDVREPNSDNARHLLISNTWFDFIRAGDVLAPFREFVGYPPGVHLVGVPVQALFGLKMPAMVFAENLVFVPLLALGCYGTAKLAFGRTAGLLAVLFALAAPMLMSMFHVFMLDAPEAAMVAVTVWLLLLSERFQRPGIAALAGLAAAYGMYTKATFVLFIAGVVVVMLVRGGWRHWKGWLVFAIIVAVLAGPWYVHQLDVLRGTTTGLVGPDAGGGKGLPVWYGGIRYPGRDSLWNYQWYGWSLVNHTLYLPLTLFFATGVGWALWRLRSAAGRASLIPELLAGGLVGYLGVSLIVLKDPRYSLPCLVYIAVLAVAWIAALPRKPRVVAAALLAGVFVFNTVTHNFGVGGSKSIQIGQPRPGNPIGQHTLTIFRDSGYFEGPPVRSHARFVDLLNRLHDERGVREAILDGPTFTSLPHSTTVGMMVVVKSSKLALSGFHPDLLKGPADVKEATDVWIARLPLGAVQQKPCILAPGDDDRGIYVYVGRTPSDYNTVKPDCP